MSDIQTRLAELEATITDLRAGCEIMLQRLQSELRQTEAMLDSLKLAHETQQSLSRSVDLLQQQTGTDQADWWKNGGTDDGGEI